MDNEITKLVNELAEKNDAVRMAAVNRLMELTEEKVDWIYDYLDVVLDKFGSDNSYQRCIAAKITANLAKSDTEKRLIGIIGKFAAQMDDEKFITARLTIQAAPKFGTASEEYAKAICAAILSTLKDNRHLSTHGNLIRLDAVTSLSEILKKYPGAADKNEAQRLISEQCDAKEAMKLMGILDKGK